MRCRLGAGRATRPRRAGSGGGGGRRRADRGGAPPRRAARRGSGSGVQVEVRRQLGGELDVVLCRPPVRRAKLGEDRGEACVRACFLDGAQLCVGGSGDADEPQRMAASHLVGASGVGEPVGGEGANGLQQVEARRRAGAVDAHERSSRPATRTTSATPGLTEHSFDVAGDDRPGEHGELGERASLALVEARFGPGEQVAETAVACRRPGVVVSAGCRGARRGRRPARRRSWCRAARQPSRWRAGGRRGVGRCASPRPRRAAPRRLTLVHGTACCGRLGARRGERCDAPDVFAVRQRAAHGSW